MLMPYHAGLADKILIASRETESVWLIRYCTCARPKISSLGMVYQKHRRKFPFSQKGRLVGVKLAEGFGLEETPLFPVATSERSINGCVCGTVCSRQ